MRSLSVVVALVGAVVCQELWHLEKVGVAPDAAPDAPAPDAAPDAPAPMCPATYTVIGGGTYRVSTRRATNNIGVEHCAHFDSQHTGRINNIDCTSPGATPHPYVCECDSYANDTTTYP